MNAQPVLRLVDPFTGEVTERQCPHCQAKEDELNELIRKFRAQSRDLAELRRDREGEARTNEHWPDALECFIAWQEQCKHSKSAWSAERFYLVLPFLKRGEHGKEMVLRAIAGAAYDPFTYTLKNGRTQRSDNWEKIFESVGTFERFCNRAPRGWSPPDAS